MMRARHISGRVSGATLALVLVAGLGAAVGGLGLGTADARTTAAARVGETTYPVLDQRSAADPTVAQVGDTWVALSTGRSLPRATAPTPNGPWTDAGNALVALPGWASGDAIWAPDLIRTDAGWVLYFSAPVDGLGPDGRCIGVATAASPLDAFTPADRPLVCPRRAATPPAYDEVRPAGKNLPKRAGVIDPESFTDRFGRRFVLYRTQGQPSTIRMVRVTRNGRAGSAQRASMELVRTRGVIENPVLVERAKRVVLITSQSPFVGCRYTTTWRKARDVGGLARAKKRVLIDSARTGLCGPGGADIVAGSDDSLMFLHAWSCRDLRYHCPAGNNYDLSPTLGSHRAMFGATLSWSRTGSPSLAGFLTPPTNPWAPPPSPTPTPSASPSAASPSATP